MAEKKFPWKKKHNTGLDVLNIDGVRVTVRPGDHVTATISELGSCAHKYEQVAPSTRRKPLTDQEIAIAKIQPILEAQSELINKDFKPGIGDIRYTPKDVKGLRELLADKQEQAMGAAMFSLREAKRPWAYECKIDPKGLKTLKNPEEPHLTNIAHAQAVLNVLNLEIRELKIRLELAIQAEEKQTDNRAEKLKYHGFAQHRNHRYHEVDGRLVEYKENRPYFKDNGEDVVAYLEKCKTVRTEKDEKARTARAARRKEQRLIEEGAQA